MKTTIIFITILFMLVSDHFTKSFNEEETFYVKQADKFEQKLGAFRLSHMNVIFECGSELKSICQTKH